MGKSPAKIAQPPEPDKIEAEQITRSIARTLARRRRHHFTSSGTGAATKLEPATQPGR